MIYIITSSAQDNQEHSSNWRSRGEAQSLGPRELILIF